MFFETLTVLGPEAGGAHRQEMIKREIIWFNLVYKLCYSYSLSKHRN